MAAAREALGLENVKASIGKIGMEVTNDPPDRVAKKLGDQSTALGEIVKIVGVPAQ